MLHVVLADAELELVPETIQDHSQVRAHAKRRDVDAGELVLDSSHHHAAIREARLQTRRGRPDITHFALLTVLESRAGKAGLVRPWLHTRGDVEVEVDPETRLPKQLERFKGLARQLLTQDRVGPEGKDLLAATRDRSLADVLADRPDPVVVLAEDGEAATQADVLDAVGEEGTLVVGAFPEGGFESELPDAPRLRLGEEPLMAWAVAGEVVAGVAGRELDVESP